MTDKRIVLIEVHSEDFDVVLAPDDVEIHVVNWDSPLADLCPLCYKKADPTKLFGFHPVCHEKYKALSAMAGVNLAELSFSFTTQDGQVLNEAETMELVGQEEIKILASFNTDALAAVQALVEYQNLDYRVYPDNWLEIVHGLQPITEHHRD